MKITSNFGLTEAKKAVLPQYPRHICMHVLTKARTDVRVMRAAKALIDAGYAVTIVDIESDGKQPLEENVSHVHIKHIFMPRSFTSARRWSFARAAKIVALGAFRLIRTPADFYHAHDEAALPACYLAACLRRKPLIFDAHELPLFQWPLSEMSISRRSLHELLTIFLRGAMPRCVKVITVSPPIGQELCKRYHLSDVVLVRNVPMYRVVPKSDRLRQYLGVSSNVRIALYQGGLALNRSLDKLIYAAKFLEQDIVVVLMGPGTGETLAQFEALIVSEGVADRVKIVPAIPYEELLDWTASADIGLIIYEANYSLNVKMCLPNKLFEYLMAGLPILASSLDAVSDIIKTYDVGQIVSSLAPHDIAAAINMMLTDRDALARMRFNALEAAKNHLNWEKESQQIVHLYQFQSLTGLRG
jgi:glycosyltransferase involved in cell wall biosynthesis